MNAKKQHHDWNSDYYYNQVHTQGHGKAGDCIKCGKCEKACPQHLEIRKLLEEVSEVFEKQRERQSRFQVFMQQEKNEQEYHCSKTAE